MHQLMALRAWMQEDVDQIEGHMIKSVELQENLSYSYGPPEIQKPTHELYADWLMSVGREQEARVQYEKALERAPKRRLASERLIENDQA
jgi:predicted RNA polymerase sigma factor